MSTRSTILWPVIALIFNAALSAYAEIRAGVIGGLSGPVAPYGVAARNGLLLAIEKNAGQDFLKLSFEDDQFIPSRTVIAYQKFKARGDLDLVMATGSTPALALAPLVARDGMPLIACASDERVSRGNPLVLRNWVSGRSEGETVARMVRQSAYQKYSLVYATDDYSRAVAVGLKDALPSGSIVLEQELPQEEQDFRTLLARVKSTGSDAALLCLNAGQPGLFALQARQLKMALPIFGCITLESSDELEQSKGALKGARYVAVPVADWFEKEYLGKYGNTSVVSVAAAFYDVGSMLIEFSRQGIGRADLMAAFDKASPRQGAVGPFKIITDQSGRSFHFELTVREVQ